MLKKIFKFGNKKKRLLGIDYDCESVKILDVKMLKNQYYEIHNYIRFPVKEANQNATELERFALSLEDIKKENLFFVDCNKYDGVAIAIPASIIITKNIPLAEQLKPKEVKHFLQFNAEKYFGLQNEKFNYDYQIITKDKNVENINYELKIVAARKEQILKYLKVFQNIDVKIDAIDVDVFALKRSIRWFYNDLKSPYAIVNIDTKRFIFCVVNDRNIIYFHTNYGMEFENVPYCISQIISQIEMYLTTHQLGIQNIIMVGKINMTLVREIKKIMDLSIFIPDIFSKLRSADMQDNKQNLTSDALFLFICLGMILNFR